MVDDDTNVEIPATSIVDDETIEYIAQKTDGFSGRNISYLILAIEKAVLAQDKPEITRGIIDIVVEQAVKQRTQSLQFQSHA